MPVLAALSLLISLDIALIVFTVSEYKGICVAELNVGLALLTQ